MPHIAPLFGIVSTWLTPFWLFAAGITLGMVAVFVPLGIFTLFQQGPKGRNWKLAVITFFQEGFLKPLFVLGVLMTVFTVLPFVFTSAGFPDLNQRGFLRSLLRLPAVQSFITSGKVNPPTDPNAANGPTPQSLAIHFQGAELAKLEMVSDQTVALRIPEENATRPGTLIVLNAGEKWEFTRGTGAENPFYADVTHVEAIYEGTKPATIAFSATIDVEYPEVRFVIQIAIAFVAIIFLHFLMRLILPKVYAVAMATCKEGVGQPLFYLVLALGIFCIGFFIIIPMYTFGEDIKMYKEAGLTLIMILSLVLTLWNSSVSIAEEIEGKTAVTVLSKPIGRREFVLGKFFGILGPVAVTFLVLGTFFLMTTSLKVVYDQRESAKAVVFWNECYKEMLSVVPGLLLGFMEIMVLASISVALSTRLPMLPNLLICFSVFVLGHIVPLIVSSDVGKLPMVAFVGQLVATILPVLDHFNIQAAISGGTTVPATYLWMTLGYSALFCTMALLIGLFLFEDRDVA